MKRGFLNTDKAKRQLEQVTDAQASDLSDRKDKGKKAKADTSEDTDASACWRDLPILDLHAPPPPLVIRSHHKKGRDRFIFRHWPRDPNGRTLRTPDGLHGKEAGNGIEFWGATLYDFYFVRRRPGMENFQTISSGSKLAKIMRAFDEREHARSEIAWADREADPKEIPAWNPAEAIETYEHLVHAGSNGESSAAEVNVQMLGGRQPVANPAMRKDAAEVALDISADSESELRCRSTDVTNDPSMQPLPSDIPVESPFHPSHYPSPWPFDPFESPYTPFALQRAIPTHLLPKKLHVHDPWGLLCTDRGANCDPDAFPKAERETWASKDDHVRTYTLSLPLESQEAVPSAAADEAEAAERVFVPQQEMEGPTDLPAIRAVLPRRPRKPTEISEAHLYLSPEGRLGTGHHSIVYEAELELPRNLFCESTYCESCLDEQIEIEVDRLKESGVWEQQMREAAKNYESSGRHETTSSGSPSSSSFQLPPRYVGFITWRHEHVPMLTMKMVNGNIFPLADAPEEQLSLVSDAETNYCMAYEGPTVSVHPNIQWQDPSFPETICNHQAEKKKPVPRTSRFRVAAKLSLPGDLHLAREARNYLKFPAHFFQHWNGYNVVPPLRDPTPVGALVPQFFGYYTPDDPSGSGDRNEAAYCSPILLIEHCGTPINIPELCVDDRHECAALLFRFHAAGWIHASFAERNILMQKQQPTCSPLEDENECSFPHEHRRYSFRLIDFGRSVEGDGSERSVEEGEGQMLFGLL